MLRGVTFDFWGTLMMDRPEGLRRAQAERIRRMGEILSGEGITRGPEAIHQAYNHAGERLTKVWSTLRDMGAREQVGLMLESLGIGEDAPCPEPLMDRLLDAYTAPILSEPPVPIDGVYEVLSSLEGRGLRLAVICNTGRTPGQTLRMIMERSGLARHFLVQTYSDELGLRKPHPEIFLQTLKAVGVDPRSALHVGDTLESDIAGAQSVGMRAIHFCHNFGADPMPQQGETIFRLAELLSRIH